MTPLVNAIIAEEDLEQREKLLLQGQSKLCSLTLYFKAHAIELHRRFESRDYRHLYQPNPIPAVTKKTPDFPLPPELQNETCLSTLIQKHYDLVARRYSDPTCNLLGPDIS
jgi:hypothetical protein